MQRAGVLVRSFRTQWKTRGKGRARLGRVQSRREVTEDDLLKLVGSRKELEDLMKDEEFEDPPELPADFPHSPRFMNPLPKKGTRNSKLHRQTDVLRRGRRTNDEKEKRKETTVVEVPSGHVKPIPWDFEPDLRPKEPFVYFPPLRKAYAEQRSFQWKRNDYIPGIGSIYPEEDIEVTVTVTNTVKASEKWAKERLEEGRQIYGLETKWWTWEEPGRYYSASQPGKWSDLALLQLATEHDVLLLQPLDIPVEKIGPKLRQLLKFKFLKKASFKIEPKVKALKMCDVKIHGCHDFGTLLKLQLGLNSVNDLPIDLSEQDLSSVARFLVGFDLQPREMCKARWEQDYLDDKWVELAAKEAWSCWVLYGIVTRMERRHVELWNASLPEFFRSNAFISERKTRKKLLKEKGTVMQDVKFAETSRTTAHRTPNWKVAKKSAVELAHDIGLDLQIEVDNDTMYKT